MKTKQLAVFDFDGTLTTCDTFVEFALKSAGRARLFSAMLCISPWLVAWKLRLIEGGRAKQKLFSALYAGRPHDWLVRQGEDFAISIDTYSRPEIVQALHKHIERGYDVYIVSASLPEWIRPWALKQGIPADHVIGTECEIDERGTITGKFATPNCYGPEKVRRLAAAIGDLSSYHITAYGDSAGDTDLFAVADIRNKI